MTTKARRSRKRAVGDSLPSANGSSEYEYLSREGERLFRVVRHDPKGFHQDRWVESAGTWRHGLGDVERVLYRLPEVLAAASAGRTVWVVEGEKDADAMHAAGVVATTPPGGAGKWRGTYTDALKGARQVNIVYDRDDEGKRHALKVGAELAAAGMRVRYLRAKVGNDASDHLAAGHSLEDFVRSKPRPKPAPQEARTSAVQAPTGHALPAVYQLALLRLTGHAQAHRLPLPRATSDTSHEACCPAHDDRNPSLGIRVGETQPLVLKCQAGCTWQDVARALDINTSDVSATDRNSALSKRLEYLRVDREAKELLASEGLTVDTPPTMTHEQYMEHQPDKIDYSIEGLHVHNSNTLLVAGYKTGKTTLLLNLARAFATGEPFLDHFNVRKLDGRVGYMDYEMAPELFGKWYKDVFTGDSSPHIAAPWHLRGSGVPFWLPEGAEAMQRWIDEQEIEVLILDPAARVWSGLIDNENDNAQMVKFTDLLDKLKADTGVEDLILATHTGRTTFEEDEERSRGATRLEDWADSMWYLTKDKATGMRAIRADGRGVDMEAVSLHFSIDTKRLSTSGITRRDSRIEHGVADALRSLATFTEPPSTNSLKKAMSAAERTADGYIQRAMERGWIERFEVANGYKCRLTDAGRDQLKQKVKSPKNESVSGRSDIHEPPRRRARRRKKKV